MPCVVISMFGYSTHPRLRRRESQARPCGVSVEHLVSMRPVKVWPPTGGAILRPPLTISVPTMSAAFPFIYPNGLDPRPRPIETIVRKRESSRRKRQTKSSQKPRHRRLAWTKGEGAKHEEAGVFRHAPRPGPVGLKIVYSGR